MNVGCFGYHRFAGSVRQGESLHAVVTPVVQVSGVTGTTLAEVMTARTVMD